MPLAIMEIQIKIPLRLFLFLVRAGIKIATLKLNFHLAPVEMAIIKETWFCWGKEPFYSVGNVKCKIYHGRKYEMKK